MQDSNSLIHQVAQEIPEAEAVDRLVDLIREHGKWVEPEVVGAAAP